MNKQPLKMVKASPAVSEQPQEVSLEFSPDPAIFKRPDNYVTARIKPGSGSVTFADLQLDVLNAD